MIANAQTIKAAAENFLKRENIAFSEMGVPLFHPATEKEAKHGFDYWVVPYVYTVFEEEDAFVYLDDANKKIMYVLTKHGKQFIDGKEDTAPAEDAGEDWDDL